MPSFFIRWVKTLVQESRRVESVRLPIVKKRVTKNIGHVLTAYIGGIKGTRNPAEKQIK